MFIAFIYFILSNPFPDDFDFSKEGQFKFISHSIIVLLCMLNLFLYYFNLYN